MNFMTSYKRLDNLCKDLLGSDKGASSYIEENLSASKDVKLYHGYTLFLKETVL